MKIFDEHKSVLAGIGFTFMVASLAACDRSADWNMNPGDAETSSAYDTGYEFGIRLALLQQRQPGIGPDEAFKGMLDALADTNQQVSYSEVCARLEPSEVKPAESVDTSQLNESMDNVTDDDAVFNSAREVEMLPSGVQYEVLQAGTGEPPKTDDAVMISYRASFADGTVLDTSDDGEAQYIRLEDIVVPGLKEALLLMNTGARWQVVVPPSMGFTRSGNRKLRRQDLIYDIKLVSIDRAQPITASE